MSAPRKYDHKFRERAVRMYRDRLAGARTPRWAPVATWGALLDLNPATLRNWIRDDNAANGDGPPSSEARSRESEEVRALKKRVAELERANEILKTSAVSFAKLLAWAWQAANNGSREMVLTEEIIDTLVDGPVAVEAIPPHVEVAARVHADDCDAIQAGSYTLTVAPARAGGTLTSRFTPTTTGSGLEQVYADLPVSTRGALLVQLSFPPAYPMRRTSVASPPICPTCSHSANTAPPMPRE